MFGMGLGEILLIGIVAILFLGPDKLPGAMVQTAKFFRQFKRGITEAKDTLEKEINLSEMKEQASEYQKKLLDTTQEVGRLGSNFQLPSYENFMDEKPTEPATKEIPVITPHAPSTPKPEKISD